MSEEEKAKNLWFEFDNYFLWNVSPKIGQAVGEFRDWPDNISPGELTSEQIREYINTEKAKAPNGLVDGVKQLAPNYLQIFNNYFGENFDQQSAVKDSFSWKAFVDFGLGVLYDPRRPRDPSRFIHVMDEEQGYITFHRFNWIGSMIYLDPPSRTGRWLYLDRLIGLAAELQSRSKPRQSSPDGAEPTSPRNGDNISMNEIHAISDTWLNLNFEDVEKKLATLKPWKPPEWTQ
ncbi:MAG: hypothetical protein WA364_03660 [Candidatus Nitrosopolaris sp.]